ncbi:unnamed protein product, partial [Staurois parvus]
MYTQTHVFTYKHTHTHIHVHTHRHMYRYTYVHKHRHMHMHTQTHTNIHICTHTNTHTPFKKLQYLVVPSQIGYCTLGGGREHSTHSFLCSYCAQLLSSLTAPCANERSVLSSEPAQQDCAGGHTRPHHNFQSPLASRRVEISRPGLI